MYFTRLLIISFFIIPCCFIQAIADWDNYNRAIQNFRTAQFDSTLYYAKQIHSSDSLYFYAQLLVGHTYLEMDSLEHAKSVFEPLLNYREERFYVYNGLGLYYLYKYEKNRSIARILKKIFSSDDLERARNLFDRAHRMNSEYFDAQLNKCRALIASEKETDLRLAGEKLAFLAGKYPENAEIFYQRGICKKLLGDTRGSILAFNKVLVMNSLHSAANLSLAFIYFDSENYILFSDYYVRSLPTLYDQKLLKKLYWDVFDILSSDELRYTKDHRLSGDFFIQFWRVRNPIRITQENERLIEHYKRLEHARTHYPGTHNTGYDDRGKIYVRYGEPDNYVRSNIHDGYIMENESWVYQINDETYNFDFVDEGAGYVLRKDLRTAVKNPDFRSGFLDLQNIYSRRAHLSNYYANIHRELITLHPDAIPEFTTSVPNIFNRYYSRESAKMNDIPVSVYNVQLEGEDLHFDYNTFKFFNQAQKLWFIDIFYGIDLSQIEFRYRNDKYYGNLRQDLVVFSQDRLDENRNVNMNLSFVSTDKELNKYFVKKITTVLFRGENEIHFQLKNNESNRFRIVEMNTTVPSLNDNLNISDILLSDDVHFQASEDDTLFCRNEFYIHPNPSRSFHSNKSIFCYIELYNVDLSRAGSGRCLIEYKLQEFKTGKNLSSLLDIINPFKSGSPSRTAVAVINEFEIKSDFQPLVLAFDVSNLNNGIYQLTVTATDLNSKQKVSSEKLLQIID